MKRAMHLLIAAGLATAPVAAFAQAGGTPVDTKPAAGAAVATAAPANAATPGSAMPDAKPATGPATKPTAIPATETATKGAKPDAAPATAMTDTKPAATSAKAHPSRHVRVIKTGHGTTLPTGVQLPQSSQPKS